MFYNPYCFIIIIITDHLISDWKLKKNESKIFGKLAIILIKTEPTSADSKGRITLVIHFLFFSISKICPLCNTYASCPRELSPSFQSFRSMHSGMSFTLPALPIKMIV